MAETFRQPVTQTQSLKNSIDVKNGKLKSRFELQAEKDIENYVATLSFEEAPSNNLISPELKRTRIIEELKEQAKLSELSGFIESAFHVLTYDGKRFLSSEQFNAMIGNFIRGNEALEVIDLKSPPNANFQAIMHFSDSTLDSILTVAVGKYNEAQYFDSLGVFILLAVLNPENPDYWLRAGIVAHKCEKMELASRLYNATSELDPSLPSPWIFSIDCFLKRNMPAEALAAYNEAVKLNEETPLEESLSQMLKHYKSRVIPD